jgi:hypothetical protein
MTGKIRMMSAGMGGASRYRVNPWGNQGGGNKKQGLPPTTNKPVQYVLRAINRRAYGTPQQRATVYYINQLSTIGRMSTMFAPRSDGVRRK